MLTMLAVGVFLAHKPDTTPVFHPDTGRYSFAEYDCDDDCSAQQRGYEWAKERGIDKPENCKGYSPEFVVGCRVRVDEVVEAQEDLQHSDGDGW